MGITLLDVGWYISKAISQVLYLLCWMLFCITDQIEKAILMLGGIRPINNDSSNPKYITELFNITDPKNYVGRLLIGLIGVALALMVIIFVITIAKAYIKKEANEKIKDVGKNFAQALVLVFILPFALYYCIRYTSEIIGLVYGVLNSGERGSTTQSIFVNMFEPRFYFRTTGWDNISDDIKWGKFVKELGGLELNIIGDNTFSLNNISNLVKKNLGNPPYPEEYLMLGYGTGFNFLIALLCGVVLIYNFIMVAIPTVNRLLICMISMGTASPIAATTVAGDKTKFQEWAKTFVGSLLSIVGTILAISFFGAIVGSAMAFTQQHGQDMPFFMKMIITLLITICGGIGLTDIKNTLDQIISNGVGVNVKGGGLGKLAASAMGFGAAVKSISSKKDAKKEKSKAEKDEKDKKKQDEKDNKKAAAQKDQQGGYTDNGQSGANQNNKEKTANSYQENNKTQSNQEVIKASENPGQSSGGAVNQDSKPTTQQGVNEKSKDNENKEDIEKLKQNSVAKDRFETANKSLKSKDTSLEAKGKYNEQKNQTQNKVFEEKLNDQKEEMKKQQEITRKIKEQAEKAKQESRKK